MSNKIFTNKRDGFKLNFHMRHSIDSCSEVVLRKKGSLSTLSVNLTLPKNKESEALTVFSRTGCISESNPCLSFQATSDGKNTLINVALFKTDELKYSNGAWLGEPKILLARKNFKAESNSIEVEEDFFAFLEIYLKEAKLIHLEK